MVYIRKSVRNKQQEKRLMEHPDYKGDGASSTLDCTKLLGEYKYIVYKDHDGEHMIVFPKQPLHCDVARKYCKNKIVPSAGFIIIGLLENDECRGVSKSLDRESRPEDVLLLKDAKFVDRA